MQNAGNFLAIILFYTCRKHVSYTCRITCMKSSYTCFRHISEVMANLTITFTKLSLLNLFWRMHYVQMAGGPTCEVHKCVNYAVLY